jgi:HPt (histidine-containing phosphotransfer) domain-containing protein
LASSSTKAWAHAIRIALVLALATSLSVDASGAEREPANAPQPGDGSLGRAVVISLALLFAGVSLGQLGLSRARARRRGLAGGSRPSFPALDANTPRSETVTKIFLQHAPAQVAAIGRALDAGDAASVSAAAHKLKGSCLAIGAPRMADLCKALESGASGGRAQYAELCESLVQAERELTEHLVSAADRVS